MNKIAFVWVIALMGCGTPPPRGGGQGGAAVGAEPGAGVGGADDPAGQGAGAGGQAGEGGEEGEGEGQGPGLGEGAGVGEGEGGGEGEGAGEGEGGGEGQGVSEGEGEGVGEGEAGGDGGEPVVGDIGPSLNIHGGCADMVLYAHSGDEKMAVLVRVHGIVGRAHEAADATEELFDVAGGGVEIELQLGEGLGGPLCNDVLEPGWRIDHDIEAHAGRFHVVVRPEGSEFGRATADLQGVEFEHPMTGEIITIGDLRWVDVFVGWLAG